MMFNVPIPDGTTAHAAGAVLVAVLLGPWAAVIAMSTAFIIQALFFGDGGVLAIGANCFNMAFVMPFVGYAVYRALTRTTSLTDRRRAVAAGLGGYVGLNVAASCQQWNLVYSRHSSSLLTAPRCMHRFILPRPSRPWRSLTSW